MIIKLKKLHVFAAATVLIVISFVLALNAEERIMPASATKGISLPVVMYHHITEKDSRAGTYVVKKSELENDLDFLKSKGYTTVTVSDLISYVDGKKQLPEKVVMITFDDGFLSVYRYAYELLKDRNMKAVLSAVGTVTETYTENGDENINYAYMSWDMLAEIDRSDEFEVQNHTYDMHRNGKTERKGLSKMSGESEEDYVKALKADLSKMQTLLKENSGINATAAVYPYGAYSPSTLGVVKALGFRCSMVCEERVNVISPFDQNCLYNLGRYNRPSGISTENFFKKLNIE